MTDSLFLPLFTYPGEVRRCRRDVVLLVQLGHQRRVTVGPTVPDAEQLRLVQLQQHVQLDLLALGFATLVPLDGDRA